MLHRLSFASLLALLLAAIVTHKPNIIDAFGKDWFEVKEGETTIFKPDGTTYKVIARIQMDEWPRIATAAKK
jgi:hypothetical protein